MKWAWVVDLGHDSKKPGKFQEHQVPKNNNHMSNTSIQLKSNYKMSFKVLISQINEVIILQMKEAMHVIGYSTLSIRT